MTTLVQEAANPSRVAYGAAPRCDGWPTCGCPNEATEMILSFQLCVPCARAFVAPDPDYVPVEAPLPPPVACVWCSSTSHPASKCPVAAALTGAPLIAGLRAEIENLKAANIALQHELIHQAETAGYAYELLNSLLRGTIKLSTGRAAIKKAMARLCPGAVLS